ncbi:MAG TPA: DUF4091 domain-containing protein [Armatimonadota bacterium]|nr:DUF4091 domain-containing protein [Armatimonadota bacterium]
MFARPSGALALGLLVVLLLERGSHGQQAPFEVWSVDALEKVLPSAAAPAGRTAAVSFQGARGEYESAQLVVRSDQPIANLRVELSELTGPEGAIPADALAAHFVGFVPIEANTYATPREELVAPAPCELPDPLLPDAEIAVGAGRCQPVWLTLRIPDEAASGVYAGTVRLLADGGEIEVPVEATVWPFAVPSERHLQFTNWLSADRIAEHHGVTLWSEEFWAVFDRYAQAMGEHRQTMAWAPLSWIAVTEEADGAYVCDFSRFDRWVQTCERHGVAGHIEIQQVGGFEKDWSSTTIVLSDVWVTERATGRAKAVPGQVALPRLLPLVEAHLRERGWLDRTLIHIADEPSQHNTRSWSEVADYVHEQAPGIRRIDAIEGPYFAGHLEVMVPKLNHLRHWWPIYARARDEGAELWFYTCCHPTGLYPNRFLDYSLLKTRILHWYNWRFGLAGYLHWGLNWWTADPFRQVTSNGLPPGDCFIIYPGPDGPLSSIRWEALRDGIEDYEYLWVLRDATSRALERIGAGRLIDPGERSDEICRGIVRDFLDYTDASADLRAARERIASEIVAMDQAPLLVVATDPPEWQPLAEGPIWVNVRGAVERGAIVTVNGQAVTPDERGEFIAQAPLSGHGPRVTVKAELEGRQKTVERAWPVLERRPQRP